MKKILVAFDSSHYSEGALAFADQLRKKQPVFITAAFLPLVDYAAFWSYAVSDRVTSMVTLVPDTDDTEKREANIRRFENFCREREIPYSVHKQFNDFALAELKKETRFADLLILGSERFYIHNNKEFLYDALRDVECPVIIVPEKFDFPDHTILAYDGTANSVYAIRQFCYVLPGLVENDTTLLYASDEEEPLPHEQRVRELITRHFSKVNILQIHPATVKEFTSRMKEREASMVVSGAFGRRGLARLFHKSFIADVIQDHRLPVFIAHR